MRKQSQAHMCCQATVRSGSARRDKASLLLLCPTMAVSLTRDAQNLVQHVLIALDALHELQAHCMYLTRVDKPAARGSANYAFWLSAGLGHELAVPFQICSRTHPPPPSPSRWSRGESRSGRQFWVAGSCGADWETATPTRSRKRAAARGMMKCAPSAQPPSVSILAASGSPHLHPPA